MLHFIITVLWNKETPFLICEYIDHAIEMYPEKNYTNERKLCMDFMGNILFAKSSISIFHHICENKNQYVHRWCVECSIQL